MLPERPKLRPGLTITADPLRPGAVILVDAFGFNPSPCRLTRLECSYLTYLDGTLSLTEIGNMDREKRYGKLSPDGLSSLVNRLDNGLFLDGPQFRQRADHPVRDPRCIGCYSGHPKTLRKQLQELFTAPEGSGMPNGKRPDGKLRAALIPHIDYPRGGHSYTWGFKEVVERSAASLFVIIGTSHYSAHRFTLTRKDFKTPLGILSTDREYIDRLVHHYGDGLFEDEWMAHFPEHSIELEVVFLQFLYENRRPIRIVPLVVGSFHDCIHEKEVPSDKKDISRMVQALRKAEQETREPICYIISGDLAHIGPKFGDSDPVNESVIAFSRGRDMSILEKAEKADAAGMFRIIAGENDDRRICGLPPTFTTLEVARPNSGRVLHYDQYIHPRGHESVSFASVAYYE